MGLSTAFAFFPDRIIFFIFAFAGNTRLTQLSKRGGGTI